MSATVPVPPLFDETRLAIAGFLARYSGPTRTAYATDLRQYFAWCADQGLDVFAARRGHLELWAPLHGGARPGTGHCRATTVHEVVPAVVEVEVAVPRLRPARW